jgi:hypothetical protein
MSLNRCLRDPEWIVEYEKRDALATRIKAFFLPGKAIENNVQCRASTCKLIESEKREATFSFSFCFACNRTFHIECVDLTVSSFVTESVPWRCPFCRENEENDVAKAYFQSYEWKKGLKLRREKLLSKESIFKFPALLEPNSDDELDESLYEAAHE